MKKEEEVHDVLKQDSTFTSNLWLKQTIAYADVLERAQSYSIEEGETGNEKEKNSRNGHDRVTMWLCIPR